MIPEATTEVRTCLFAIGIHEALERGCTLNLRLLQENSCTSDSSGSQLQETITIPANVPDVFKRMNLTPAAVTHGPYHKPDLKPFEALDSFYLPQMEPGNTEVTAQDLIVWNATNRLILFRVTVLKSLPVNASAIMWVLEKLGLVEAVKSDPMRVALVHVAPQAIVGDYKRQEIVPEVPDTLFKTISPRMRKYLAGLGIETADQVKAAVEANIIKDASTVERNCLYAGQFVQRCDGADSPIRVLVSPPQ